MLPGAPRGPPTGLSLRNHCATWISVGPVQGQKPHAGHMNRVQASLLGRLLGGTRIPAEKCQYLEIRPILFPHRKHHQSTLLPHDAQSQVYLRPDLRASALRTYIWWTWEVLPKDPRALDLFLWNSTCGWQLGSQHSGPPSVEFSSAAQSCLTLQPQGQ